MTTATQNLIQMLTLDQKSHEYFLGQSQPILGTRIFGGQLLAQSIMAAAPSTSKTLHSLHAYFLCAGDASVPVLYKTEILRNSFSFCTIQVNALQFGKRIFTAMLSYMKTEDGLNYQSPQPVYPPAEQLQTEQWHKQQIQNSLPFEHREAFMQTFNIESRPVTFSHPFQPKQEEPVYTEYLKTFEPLSENIESGSNLHSCALHQAIAAYYSDYNLYTAAFNPHGLSYASDKIIHASLDHAVYFHRPLRADESMLYEMKTAITAYARGLSYGQMWQNGYLVCSTQQENLMRQI
ncbi:acyl-CoA thioesterase [Acinetobacter pragensis]|uniref:acyl-CoA thioesterase n=1 Tax=Acinetobacter pragensis TaxID=1806892 RepID=UPI00333F1A91